MKVLPSYTSVTILIEWNGREHELIT